MSKRLAAFFLCSVLACSIARADIVTYYVGLDQRSTPFNAPDSAGGGAYPDNPNSNRLTLLLHHGDHYHGIGSYAYSGAAAAPVFNDTNTNNRVPETFTGMPPLSLLRGSGAVWGATYRTGIASTLAHDEEYGNFEFRNAHSLQGEDDVTYNSSGGRWSGRFDAADIYLELISATAGLNIAVANDMTALAVGDDIRLGAGNEMFSLLPTFWVDGSAAVGSRYSAEFRLLDQADAFGDSGRFFVDLQVVPAPASALLLLTGAVLLRLQRRGNA